MGKKSKGCLIAVGVGVGLFACLVIFGLAGSMLDSDTAAKPTSVAEENTQPPQVSENNDNTSSNVAEPTSVPDKPTQVVATEAVPATAETVIVDNAPSFEVICGNSTTGGQTEVVWDNFKKETEGKYFVDRLGVVKNVDQGLFGGYNLIIDVGKSYGGCSLEIFIDVSRRGKQRIESRTRYPFQWGNFFFG